jgi:hypothetical protein
MYKDISIETRCIASQGKTSCESTTNPGCKWFKGKVVGANQQVVPGSKLFENNFCHPATIQSWEAQGQHCIPNQDETSCQAAGCVWSTGVELVPPEGDFCQVETI